MIIKSHLQQISSLLLCQNKYLHVGFRKKQKTNQKQKQNTHFTNY